MTPDTSVLVAAFSTWHEHHGRADVATAETSDLIGHVTLECFSVLTRLPPPHRRSPGLVAAWLDGRFPGERLGLDGVALRGLPARLAAAGISGGATYDALIADTAAAHGLPLITLDARAARTYARLAVPYELLA